MARATKKTPGQPAVKSADQKLVRDSFTIPKQEYALLGTLKERALGLAQATKKSELLRAGIKALEAMNDVAFLAALKAVPLLKTGRPPNRPAKPALASKARKPPVSGAVEAAKPVPAPKARKRKAAETPRRSKPASNPDPAKEAVAQAAVARVSRNRPLHSGAS